MSKKIHQRYTQIRERFLRNSSASSAVEFALTAPLFILLMFGTTAYGTIMSTYSAVQQLTAEGARATVAGLTDTERDQLARGFVTTNVGGYPLLDPTKLTVSTTALSSAPPAFQVTLKYDMSNSFIYTLGGVVPLPAKTISRTAIVENGGY